MLNATAQNDHSNKAKNPIDSKENKSFKESVYLVFNGVSNAILVTIGVGLLLSSINNFVHWQALGQIGIIAQILMAPAIGAAVASQLKTNTLVLFSSMIAATVGANNVFFTSSSVSAVTATGHLMTQPQGSGVFMIGQPISALGGAVIATLVGKWLTGKTPLDMFLVPFAATTVGTISALGLAAVTTSALVWLSDFIAQSMKVNPLIGSISISVLWALFLLTPASSAALAIAIMLDPLSSGAALMGTTVQFVTYTIMSYRENEMGTNIAQLVITPKIQFGNIIKNPWIMLPGMISAVLAGSIGTVVFNFSVPYSIAGLGLNSFIAPIALITSNMNSFLVFLVIGVLMPAVIGLVFDKFLRVTKRIKKDDMKVDLV